MLSRTRRLIHNFSTSPATPLEPSGCVVRRSRLDVNLAPFFPGQYVVLGGLALILAVGCGNQRDLQTSNILLVPELTYTADIAPLLQQKCVSCHGPDKTEGQYDLSSWRGLLGPGSEPTHRDAVPGDANSLLLTVLGNDVHHDLLDDDERATLRAWVVKDALSYDNSGYHPPTWLYPGQRDSVDFHGGFLRSQGWDTGTCKSCHGQDLAGGPSQKACASCHDKQPLQACGTCHGHDDDPMPIPSLSWGLDGSRDRGVGAHVAHMTTQLFAPLACSSCHEVPRKTDAPGHLFDDPIRHTSDHRAEVAFDHEPRASFGGVSPVYDREAEGCAVYCHGAGLSEAERIQPTLAWTNTGSCSFCHAVPMARFGGADCSVCHQQSVKSCIPGPGSPDCLRTSDGDSPPLAGVRFISRAMHGDGQAPVGKQGVEGTCYACHGTEASGGAPAPDLKGNTETSAVGVGLHARHLQQGSFTKTIACEACHRVPKRATDAGHFDNGLPAEVIFDDAASGRLRDENVDFTAKWSHQDATCTTYCHSLSAGKVEQWKWTQTPSEPLDCQSCHGMPPKRTVTGRNHTVASDCARGGCHSASFDSEGNLLTEKHINGIVEVE